MPSSYIYKPGTSKGPVFLAPSETDRGSAPTITTADGKTYTGKYLNTNEGRHQWVFPTEIIGLTDLTISFGGEETAIPNGAKALEGNGFTDLSPRAGGKGDATGSPSGDYPSGFAPGTAEGYGKYPAYQGDNFPSPVLTNYDPIDTAPYNFTDPMEFAKSYAPFVRDQLALNNEQAKEFAYSALDTELKSLAEFVPQQAELKRRETNLDNFFNQDQRLQQVERGIPGARQDLEAQRGRANIYASGQLPDEQADRGLELGVRSRAADLASAGGFGASSSVARKASDLMSATQRYQIAQQGENLISQNVNQRAGLLLAPTEYSNAGSQINVNPSVSPAQLQVQARSEINQQTTVPTSQALATNVQQNQFTTGLEQQTRTFNATNTLQNDQFNASNQNNFALTKFGYDVSYAGAVAGAAQTGSNTQLQLEQQKLAQQIFQDHQDQAQKNQQIGSILTGLTTLLAGIGGGGKGGGIGGALAGIISQIQDLFTGGSSGSAGPDFGGDDSPIGPDVGDNAEPELPPESERGPDFNPGGGRQPADEPGPDFNPGADEPIGPDTGADESPPASEDGSQPPDDTFEPFSLGRKAAYNTGSKAYDNRLTNFTNDIGVRVSPQGTKQVGRNAAAVMKGAGVSYTPGPNSQRAGVDFQGRQLYVDKTIANSTDISVGDKIVNTFKTVFDPMNVFSKEDSTTLSKIGTVASDAAFLGNLTLLAQQKNKKGFVNAILGAFQKPLLENFGKDPKDAGSISAAFTAYNLFQNWDSMSPTSKSLAIARLGMQAYQGATGVDLGKTPIPGTGMNGTPELTVGNALGLFATGYNVYGLVKNWDQYSDLQKLTGGIQTVANIANTAKNLGLLGAGTGNTAAASSVAAGGSSAGAAAGSSAGSTAASEGASILGGAAAVAGIVAGAYTVYQGWGEGGPRGRVNGALGGAAIATGMYSLGATNPYLLAGVVALSIASNTIKTGKDESQVQRDGMRSLIKKNGLADDKYNITLADGSKFDIGVDGSGGYHEARNPGEMVGDRKGKKLSAYDIDYTNDLDYASGMSGIALSRLLAGGKAKNIDQLGNQLGNAALGNVGYGKDMTRENFAKIMANQRSMFAKAGISSKEAAYALTNQAFKEGRINDSDAVAMQQAFNMMYDSNGYDTAQKLMSGRHKGIQVAESSAQTVGDSTFPAANKPFNPRDPSTFGPISQNDNNRLPASQQVIDSGFGSGDPRFPDRPGTGVTDSNRPGSAFPAGLARSFATRPGTGVTDNGNRPAEATPTGSSAKLTTKEEMKQKNKRRYYAVNQEYRE